MHTTLKEKLLVKDKWLRGLFMLLFICIKYIVSWLIVLIAVFQFIWNLFDDYPNEKLKKFTQNLNTYFYQIINFLTFNTEVKPFPFEHWPSEVSQGKVIQGEVLKAEASTKTEPENSSQ